MADLVHLEKMSRELKCPICWSLLKSAVSLGCNHIFCNLCIKESMRSMSNCPVCKVPFHRREIRAAPHMDNLVSIYKNMEIASGTNILSTQTSPRIQVEGDQEKNKLASAIEVKSQIKSKRKGSKIRKESKIRKDISKHSPQHMPKQPSFPANKRVHVTPYPISETPLRSPKFSILEDPEVELTEDKELSRNERMVPDSEEDGLLQPFFWLRDDDEDESPKKLSQQQIMETPSPYSAPRFSDIKDSDDDKTANTPTNKLGITEDCDSEMFDWTQRACSPELCLTPQKTKMHNQDRKRLLHMPEEKCQDSDSVAAPSDIVTKEDDKVGRHDAREQNLKKKRRQKGKILSTKIKSPQRCQYDNNGKGAIDLGEMFKTVSPGEQRIGRVHRKRSVNYKKSSSPTYSNNEKDNAAPVTHEQSPNISSKTKYLDVIKDNMASYRPDKRIKMTYPEQPMSKKSKAEQVKLPGDIEDSANAAEKQEQVCQVKLPDLIESIHQHSKLSKYSGSISKKRVKRRHKHLLEETIAGKFERNEGSSMVDAIAMANPGSENNQISSKSSMDSQTDFTVKSTPICKAFQGNSLRRCKKLNSPVQCTFCHSSNDTEDSGEMMHYFNGNPVAPYFNGGTNIIHSHKNCTEWAPDVYFEDGIAINLTAEVSRSRRIRCSCCGVKGAALGCYEKSCRKSFHFTCAKLMPECKWDTQNFVMLCPLHASLKLPYEVSEFQRQRRNSYAPKRSSQELLTSNPCANQNQSWTWPLGSFKWVLCCSALSAAEKETVVKFSKMSGVPIVDKWKPEVTHVIASTDHGGAYKRTLKVLKGIINGKWILKVDWVRACIESLEPIAEEKYEATIDVHGISNSPRLGRLRVINNEPKLFSGLTFYLSGDYSASYKGYLQDLVMAAGGAILQRRPISRDHERLLGVSSTDKILIVYSVEHPQKYNLDSNKVIDCRRSEAEALADASGCTLATSAWIIDSIAACKLQPLT